MNQNACNKVEFEPLLLDWEKRQQDIDISQNPYFYNDQGKPSYLNSLPEKADLILTPSIDALALKGRKYQVKNTLGSSNDPQYGLQTQLDFDGAFFEYEAMWATSQTAAAFGITLIQPGQAIQIQNKSSMLSHVEYEYGKYAGHWCPYLESGLNDGKTLFPFVSTDLEHHDFPHIFASTDQQLPLVISVARYWPEQGQIYLADLWVKRGDALYIPPKPAGVGKFIDLHNNRNAALACWGGSADQLQSNAQSRKNSIATETLMQSKDSYFYWYWNKKRTVHSQLPIEP